MTLHAFISYECQFCSTSFIPIPTAPICPKCGRKSPKVFDDFVEKTIESASFNLRKNNSFMPGGWGMFSIGDKYYWLAFQFLNFVSSNTKVKNKDLLKRSFSEIEAHNLASTFVDKIRFGKQKYQAKHLEAYFASLLLRSTTVVEKKKAKREILCFLCHSTKDHEFAGKLYSDILASGIGCWYFPEDARFGKGVWSKIDGQIQSCTKVIVVCSCSSLKSSPVLREIERALQREDTEQKDILLPVAIDNYIFQKWQHPRKADVVGKVIGSFHNWKNENSYKKSFARLLHGIEL